MTVPGIPRAALVALAVVAVVLFAAGAIWALGILTSHTDRTTRTFAAAPTIVVDADIGDVDVVGADRSDVRLVTEEKRSLWGGGHVTVSGDAAHLRLDDGCDGLPSGIPLVTRPCQVHYRLEVPRDAAVRLGSRTGDLRASTLRGATEVDGSTGKVRVSNVTGPLRIGSSTGDIRVDASTPDIAIRSATGDVEVTARAPRTVGIEATTGNIVLVVPDLTYYVDVSTGAGSAKQLVRRDDSSPRRLVVHSTAGDVMVVSDPAMG